MSANGTRLHRRQLLVRGGLYAAGSLLLGGCDRLVQSGNVQTLLTSAEHLNRYTQRLLLNPQALAREYSEADLSPHFRANGSTNPEDVIYQAHARNAFADWRLVVGGLVERPAEFSLADLRSMPSRTQITRHDCVEGWSCIGKWKGVPLASLLSRTGVKPQARYIVFHCADTLGLSAKYYESIDLIDAIHPQTILAYDMNGEHLPVPHGAPLRLRLERQLGYKMAKYIMRIEAVQSYTTMERGNGGYWEDRGYEWYAGI